MSKGKAHERGLARARARRARRRQRDRRRRRWVIAGVIGAVVLAGVSAFALLPTTTAPIVEDAPPTTPTADPTAREGTRTVACGGERPERPAEAPSTFPEPPRAELDPDARYRATVVTSCGAITIDLFTGRSPRTVENFVALARADFYVGVTFHRVIQGFMIQAGDPTGTGGGDPGYTIEGEVRAAEQEGYRRGIVAMANRGGDPNTASTQFFIVQGEEVELPPQYAVFGEVAQGMDVVDTIAAIRTGVVDGQADVPTETVHIERVTVEELPSDAGS